MSQFENVAITKQANVYFEGKVTSRKVTFADGSFKTLGIMLPGEYEFATEAAELMEITAGELALLLPGSEQWQKVVGGDSFNVPANARFQVKVLQVTDYCCTYLAD